jgi:hypothetical protein
MSPIEKQLSETFYNWELRGRGWQLWEHPVNPEPPFTPFPSYFQRPQEIIDDGKRPTFLSSIVDRITGASSQNETPLTQEEPNPEPEPFTRTELIEFSVSLPPDTPISKATCERFLSSLQYIDQPVAFELIGTKDGVTAQWAASTEDADTLHQQLKAHFPDAVHIKKEGFLQKAWCEVEANEGGIFEFGLEHEFMTPLACVRDFNLDPYIGLVGAIDHLREHEVAVFQVIFQPVRYNWAEGIYESLTDNEDRPVFVNRPELITGAKTKTAKPLFGAVLRVALKSNGRILDIAHDMAGAMSTYSQPGTNQLVPLDNSAYDRQQHELDLLFRQSCRSGMLLNTDELVSLAHPPSTSVRSPRLKRETEKTRAAPKSVQGKDGLILGTNTHAGVECQVTLNAEQRVRHTYIIGASGTGKSTLMSNLIQQDMENGQGLAIFDPHGDLIDNILGSIPANRIDDVILIDPADMESTVGFNILSAHTELEKNLLASDLVSVFQRLSTSWGDQMTSVLNNAILAFLESERGGTLVDLQRFLIEDGFRKEFLTTVQDEQVRYYWDEVFKKLTGGKSVGPIITRLGSFLDRKPIRRMVTQRDDRLDFAEIMDTGKIFLARLPQGQIGSENAYLLGSFLVSKFQQTVMARQAQNAAARRDFWLYIDEFHNFITPSMAQILTGARKYRLGLTLAHQELRQLQRDSEVASAALSNPCTRICFRVGDEDARKLADGFAHFEAKDIQNLPNFQALCRIERADQDFNLTLPCPPEQDESRQLTTRQLAITSSREKYGTRPDQAEAKETDTPVEPIPADEPEAETTTVSSKPDLNEPGKGGAIHRGIQQRLKGESESMGFYATIEKQIAGSNESIDLVIEQGDLKVACEIGVTTSLDHEIGNIRKCIKAGYSIICSIIPDEKRLNDCRGILKQCLTKDEQNGIACLQPDDFEAFIHDLHEKHRSIEAHSADNVLGIYKVKSTYAKMSRADYEDREQLLRHTIEKSIKQE